MKQAIVAIALNRVKYFKTSLHRLAGETQRVVQGKLSNSSANYFTLRTVHCQWAKRRCQRSPTAKGAEDAATNSSKGMKTSTSGQKLGKTRSASGMNCSHFRAARQSAYAAVSCKSYAGNEGKRWQWLAQKLAQWLRLLSLSYAVDCWLHN